MTDWLNDPMPRPSIGLRGWLRVAGRGAALALVCYGGLLVLLLVRMIEAPLFGIARPWTPHITQGVCRVALIILGLRVAQDGHAMVHPGALVANHSSWLDIFVLNASCPVYFVAKSEVSGWAGIGWLARATGTVFITRRGTQAKTQQTLFESRLQAGHRLLFFPEGTSTDGRRVLQFKSTLFAAFFMPDLKVAMHIQPVTLAYHAPRSSDPRYYGWWGEMNFATHLIDILSTARQGRVEVVFHPPLPVSAFPNRKDLAVRCQATITETHGSRMGEDRDTA